jgi:hypothetical protein
MKTDYNFLFALSLGSAKIEDPKKKDLKEVPIKEVPDDQLALLIAVEDEVNARAEKMACEELGIPEGEYMLGMCHLIWHYKKQILKTEYGIDWHSPAELNPDAIYD